MLRRSGRVCKSTATGRCPIGPAGTPATLEATARLSLARTRAGARGASARTTTQIPHTSFPLLRPARYPAVQTTEEAMFVWGAKGEIVNLGPQGSKHCPTCEKERPFRLMLQYTARHFWWIFKWVTGKQYAVVCDVCQRGDKLDAKVVEAKLGKSPIPFGTRWGWAFLAGMVAIAAVFGTLDDWNRGKSREAYLAAPLKGDRYVVNVSSLLKAPQSKYLYGVLRVRSVNTNSIEFDASSIFYSGA